MGIPDPQPYPHAPAPIAAVSVADALTAMGLASKSQIESVLHKAHALIHGDRQKDYGDKLPNFNQIAKGFETVLMRKLAPGVTITAEDVALCMMQVKIARLAHMPDHEDSLLDIAGYVGCYEAVQQERAEQEKRNENK